MDWCEESSNDSADIRYGPNGCHLGCLRGARICPLLLLWTEYYQECGRTYALPMRYDRRQRRCCGAACLAGCQRTAVCELMRGVFAVAALLAATVRAGDVHVLTGAPPAPRARAHRSLRRIAAALWADCASVVRRRLERPEHLRGLHPGEPARARGVLWCATRALRPPRPAPASAADTRCASAYQLRGAGTAKRWGRSTRRRRRGWRSRGTTG